MDIDIDMLLLLFVALLAGILMVMAAEMYRGSQPPPLHPGGAPQFGQQYDIRDQHYPPYGPYRDGRAWRNLAFWGLALTIVFTVLFILVLLYG